MFIFLMFKDLCLMNIFRVNTFATENVHFRLHTLSEYNNMYAIHPNKLTYSIFRLTNDSANNIVYSLIV